MSDGTPPPPGLHVGWLTDGARRAQVVGLLAEAVHPDYVSHGDLMDGRARTNATWAPDLDDILTRELAAADLRGGPFADPGLRVAIAEVDGRLVGIATVVHVAPPEGHSEPVRHARIDDLAVADGWRNRGIGATLLGWVEEQLRDVGVPRVFLESGARNRAAQQLFVRLGYDVTSVTLHKDL